VTLVQRVAVRPVSSEVLGQVQEFARVAFGIGDIAAFLLQYFEVPPERL